jgi:predicted small secreted protein
MCYFIGAPMKTILLIAAVAVASVLSSCNTTIGFGRDLRILGDGMEKSANKAKGNGDGGGDTSGAPVY